MKLWVTRPALDAAVLRDKLIAQRHDVIIEPLLQVEFDHHVLFELDRVQALIATSRNSVRAVAASRQARALMRLPLFAVGPGTASTARTLGFQSVIQGASTAADLLSVIDRHAIIDGGALLHLAGKDLAFDLAGRLRQIGHHVRQSVVYRVYTVQKLTTATISQLERGCIDGVILLSPRTAETYVNLMLAHGIDHFACKLVHFCLSQAVADRVSRLHPADVRVPRRPNLSEILALTDQTTAQS